MQDKIKVPRSEDFNIKGSSNPALRTKDYNPSRYAPPVKYSIPSGNQRSSSVVINHTGIKKERKISAPYRNLGGYGKA